MGTLQEQWLRWFRNGGGLELGGYTAMQIIKVAQKIDFTDYVFPSGDLDKHAVLRQCIQIIDRRENRNKRRRIGKGYRETSHPQRTDKGFFNIVTKRS